MIEKLFIVRDAPQAVRKAVVWTLLIALIAVFATDHMYAFHFPEISARYGGPLRFFAFAVTVMIAAPVVGLFFHMALRMNAFNAQLKELARRDGLTGLLNRTALEDLIRKRGVKGRGEDDLEDALIIIDIDHFKTVNDMHGHAAGDHVLRMVLVCIAGNVFERDHVARLGGEEFGVYLLNAGRRPGRRAHPRRA